MEILYRTSRAGGPRVFCTGPSGRAGGPLIFCTGPSGRAGGLRIFCTEKPGGAPGLRAWPGPVGGPEGRHLPHCDRRGGERHKEPREGTSPVFHLSVHLVSSQLRGRGSRGWPTAVRKAMVEAPPCYGAPGGRSAVGGTVKPLEAKIVPFVHIAALDKFSIPDEMGTIR